MFNVPTSPNIAMLFFGRNSYWPKVPIDGNAGGGVPVGAIKSRKENPQHVYGRMQGYPDTGRMGRRNVMQTPTGAKSESIKRHVRGMEVEMSRMAVLGYWSAVPAANPPRLVSDVNLAEAPNSTDPNLWRKMRGY